MFKNLKTMFDYLDRVRGGWKDGVFFSISFSMIAVLILETILSSPEEIAHVYGVTLNFKGGIVHSSLDHIILFMGSAFLTMALMIPVVELMKIFKKNVDNKKCSVFFIPIPFVILAWSCAVLFLYTKVKNVSKVVAWLWSYTVIDESKKVVSKSSKPKTIL